MATQTPNLGLTKPEVTDEILATIVALAANMDTIDGIVELGSNANGSYARFAHGLQVCWHTIAAGDLASGATTSGVWTYPQSFLGVPVALLVPTSNSSRNDIWGNRVVTSSYNSSLVPGGANAQIHWSIRDTRPSGSAGDARIFAVAVGRWK